MLYHKNKLHKNMSYIYIGKAAALIVVMVALFLLVLLILPERTAAAENTTKEYKITSVQIETGDSLWSFAEEFYTEEFSSIYQYITEIKRMNGLSSDTLYAGNYLLIPYYTAQ